MNKLNQLYIHSSPMIERGCCVFCDGNYKAVSVKKQISFAMSVSLLNPHAIIDIIGVGATYVSCKT